MMDARTIRAGDAPVNIRLDVGQVLSVTAPSGSSVLVEDKSDLSPSSVVSGSTGRFGPYDIAHNLTLTCSAGAARFQYLERFDESTVRDEQGQIVADADYAAAVVGSGFGSQAYSNLLTLIGDDIMFVGINYSQLPSAAANEGRIARVADRNNMRYVAQNGVWRPDGEGLLYRQLTFGAQQVTAGSTTTPKAVGQAVVPKDCLARNGDVVRLVFAVEKNATTDNALMNVYAGTTGVIGTDVNVASSSQTLLSGTTDNAAGYYEYKRIDATTLRRALGGAGVTSAVGNSAVNAPADFTVPNMDDNDLTFTLGLYTATAGSGPSVELATLRDFEVVVRPFN